MLTPALTALERCRARALFGTVKSFENNMSILKFIFNIVAAGPAGRFLAVCFVRAIVVAKCKWRLQCLHLLRMRN